MRVVYAIDHLDSGGAQRQAVELAVALRHCYGIDVRFLVYREAAFFGPRLREAGVPVIRLPKATMLDPLFPLRVRAWLRSQARAGQRIDVVNAFMVIPGAWQLVARPMLPRRQRPALVVSERSSRVALTTGQGLLQRFVYRGSDALTVNAERMGHAIACRFRVPEERIHYIGNGIDLDDWDRRAADEPPREPEPGRFHLALVGRLDPVKNHELVLEGVARLEPDLRARFALWFVGANTGGPGFPESIARAVGRLGLEDVVRTLPATPRLPALLRRMDALVLASQYEGFPNVVLEAMASRTLVVSAPVGEVPNLVTDGENGLLFRGGDAAALARALERAAGLSSAERSAMVERARKDVEERYRIRHIAGRYLELYRSLAASRGRSAGTGAAA